MSTNDLYAHDVRVVAAILAFKNKETVGMLMCEANPEGVQLFSYVNTFFLFQLFCMTARTRDCIRSLKESIKIYT